MGFDDNGRVSAVDLRCTLLAGAVMDLGSDDMVCLKAGSDIVSSFMPPSPDRVTPVGKNYNLSLSSSCH